MASSAESHARSLWSATAREPVLMAPALDGEREVDLAVVGGGFTGCSAALSGAEAGASVVLLEAKTIGWGASGRNGGQIIPGLKYDPSEMRARWGDTIGGKLTRVVGGAADVVFDQVAKHRIACDAKRGGWVQAAHAAPALARVQQRAREWRMEGAPIELLDGAGVERLTGTRDYLGGWIDQRAGTLHPLSYARGLARAARESGATISESSAVERMDRMPDGRWHLRTAKGEVRARSVIVATDAYSGPLVPWLGRSLLPVQSAQIATEPLSSNLQAHVMPDGRCASETRRLAFYFRLSPDGRLVFGGRGAIGDAENPIFTEALISAMRRLFPDAADVPVAYRWSGQVGLTLDGLPRIHEPAPGLLAGFGYNGRGVALATVMGMWLAAKALAGKTPPLPVTEPKPVSWHALRKPALYAGIAWAWTRDRVGFAG